MDRDVARQIEKRAIEALAPLARELGVTATAKGGTIGSTHFTLKIEFAEIKAGGQVATSEATAFTRLAKLYGLEPSDLGREFTLQGKRYKIEGLRPKATVNSIIVSTDRGARYVMPVEDVKRGLAANSSGPKSAADFQGKSLEQFDER